MLKPMAHSQKLQRSKLIWAAEAEKGWGKWVPGAAEGTDGLNTEAVLQAC